MSCRWHRSIASIARVRPTPDPQVVLLPYARHDAHDDPRKLAVESGKRERDDHEDRHHDEEKHPDVEEMEEIPLGERQAPPEQEHACSRDDEKKRGAEKRHETGRGRLHGRHPADVEHIDLRRPSARLRGGDRSEKIVRKIRLDAGLETDPGVKHAAEEIEPIAAAEPVEKDERGGAQKPERLDAPEGLDRHVRMGEKEDDDDASEAHERKNLQPPTYPLLRNLITHPIPYLPVTGFFE